MTALSLCLNFRALGRPLSLGRPIFRPSVHAGANECRSFAPALASRFTAGAAGFLNFSNPSFCRIDSISRAASRRCLRVPSCSVGEDGRPVALQVLVEAQAKASFGQHTSKHGLAHFQGITPHVVAIQLDQVESVEEGTVVWRWWRMRSNDATPLSSQATASPSMMQERERKRANVSTIRKRRVKSLPGRL